MIAVLYAAIVFGATFLGAFVGLGGGVIIKPLFDLAGFDTVDTVNFLSACAVFAMSVASTIKYRREKRPTDKKIILLCACGAVAGGILGNVLFDAVLEAAGQPEIVKSVQAAILAVLLIASVCYINLKNPKTLHVTHPAGIAAAGLMLGVTSSFLGVGGGPINVAAMVLFFSITVKDAAVYSVAVIFFTQLSKLVTIFIDNQFAPYSERLWLLLLLVPCAVLGGILGARYNKKADGKKISKVFSVAVSAIALVNIYNAVSIFFS